MKKGFYYLKSKYTIRCYYLTGEKKGNKWIEIEGYNDDKLCKIPDAEWMGLMWNFIPKEEEIKRCLYTETNPTEFKLKTL